MRRWFWGPLSPLGLGVAAVTLLIDQAHKAWMLYVYDIGSKGVITLAPFFDLVLVWNRGVSYGLFPQDSSLGRWALILFAFGAVVALAEGRACAAGVDRHLAGDTQLPIPIEPAARPLV